MTDEMAIDEIKGLLNANTLVDAVRNLREWRDSTAGLTPIASVDSEGHLRLAPLSVRQVMQLIAALENLTVK